MMPEAAGLFSQQALTFSVLGIATGSLSALVALGVVLTYRASGVLNFSAGAAGAVGAYVCYQLIGDGVPPYLALTVTILLGGLLGLLTQRVMSFLRAASTLARLIASLGLLSSALGVITIIWGGNSTLPTSFLPRRVFQPMSGLRIGEDRVIIVVLCLVLTVALRLIYSYTLFGLASSAVAESPRVAAGSGWSPEFVAAVNYVVAGMLSALAATLLAPIIGLNGSVLALTIVPALAAALVGRFSSFGVTVVAALLIGLLQSEISLFQPNIASAFGVSDLSLGGLGDSVPLVIIVGYTILSGRWRTARGEFQARLPLPGTGQISVIPLIVGTAIAATLLFEVHPWDSALGVTFGTGVLILSVVVVAGYAGQLSLCQFSLAGFGAWVAARLAATAGVTFLLALVIGVFASIVLGVVVALPALRVRGVNLAVSTLGLALLVNSLILNNSSLTGGFAGTSVPSPHVFGYDLEPLLSPQRYSAFSLVALVGAGLLVSNLRRSRSGRRLLAVRGNERAAAALGIGVYSAKLYAFGVAAGLAGLAGVLLAFANTSVSFSTFTLFGSITVVQLTVLGGLGWASGTVLGAVGASGALLSVVVVELFPSAANLDSYLNIFAGVGVIGLLRQSPDGAAAQISQKFDRLLRRLRWPSSGSSLRSHGASLPTRSPARLEIRGLSVRFGGVSALEDVGFCVEPGEVVGLIGPNGAGKTTLLDVITGFTRPVAGTVLLDGVSVNKLSVEGRARAGIARSWQSVELFEEMTVRENLLVASEDHSARHYLTDLFRPGRLASSKLIEEVTEEFDLADYLDQRPGSLSQGRSRLVGIARAIANRPAVLLLDEPAAGLDQIESINLSREIRSVAERRGIGILLVEHDVPLMMSTCDRIVVLDFGTKIAEGSPEGIRQDPRVIAAYLGAQSESNSLISSPTVEVT